MKSELPKALTPVAGKPILEHLLTSVAESGLDPLPVVVIGHERKRICDAFGASCAYAVQEEQLGTGHAVKSAQETVGNTDAVIVLYGDHPFVSAQSIQRLAREHETRGSVLTMMTTTIPSVDGWYKAFESWGRIIRDVSGHVVANRQHKDASEEERAILERDPAMYCFNANWLWDRLARLKNENSQGEYYLTDLARMAFEEGQEIATVAIPPEEAIGINSPEEKEIAERIALERT